LSALSAGVGGGRDQKWRAMVICNWFLRYDFYESRPRAVGAWADTGRERLLFYSYVDMVHSFVAT